MQLKKINSKKGPEPNCWCKITEKEVLQVYFLQSSKSDSSFVDLDPDPHLTQDQDPKNMNAEHNPAHSALYCIYDIQYVQVKKNG